MKRIAIALAFAMAATSAYAQETLPASGADVTNLSPGGTELSNVGQTVVIAGAGGATIATIAGALLLLGLVAGGGNGSSSSSSSSSSAPAS